MAKTALKHQIASGLRTLREQAGVSREDAAAVILGSVQTVGHIETGRSLPSGLQLEKLLAHYGVPERIPQFLDLRERAKSGEDWWVRLPGSVPAYRALFLGGESMADRIETWDALEVPDLAQTPDYTRALIRATEPECPAEEVERRVELLAARQIAVLGADPDLSMVVGEAALRWPVGTEAVVKAQAEYLVELAQRPGIELRVLPLDAGRRGASGSFTLLTFSDLGTQTGTEPGAGAVYTETLVEGYYYDDPKFVARYREILTGLRDAATPLRDTSALIRRIVG